jgi:hypothetical protein
MTPHGSEFKMDKPVRQGVSTSLAACPECGNQFKLHDKRQIFCTKAHRRVFEKRIVNTLGSHMIEAMAWRGGRHKRGDSTAKAAFIEFALAVDKANADAKLAGRMSALDYLRARYRRQGIFGVG